MELIMVFVISDECVDFFLSEFNVPEIYRNEWSV